MSDTIYPQVASLEENLQQSKEIISRQSATSKSKIMAGNNRITSLVADKRALEAKVAELEKSIGELQTGVGDAPPASVPSEKLEEQTSVIVRIPK